LLGSELVPRKIFVATKIYSRAMSSPRNKKTTNSAIAEFVVFLFEFSR